MTDTVHFLIERYGLIAVFLGTLAEGESVALLAGFFAHQTVFSVPGALAATFLGAFASDVLFFLAGRRYAGTAFVGRLIARPGFSHAMRLVKTYPRSFVVFSRYIYGMRLVSGIAIGLTGLPASTFMLLNALSSLVWTLLFCGLGYAFGEGIEQALGTALEKHERLFVALAFGAGVALIAGLVAHRVARRERARGK